MEPSTSSTNPDDIQNATKEQQVDFKTPQESYLGGVNKGISVAYDIFSEVRNFNVFAFCIKFKV